MIGPVERQCICPDGPRPAGPGIHESECDQAFREMFFATVRDCKALLRASRTLH